MIDAQKTQILPLNIEHSLKIANIASKVHSHPMSLSLVETCFGSLYTSAGVYFDGELQGFAILHQIFESATLIDICIEPKFQGRGFGHLLLDYVIMFARECNAETLFLEVRESSIVARSLYIRNGFSETGRRKGYYKTASGTEDAILMELTL